MEGSSAKKSTSLETLIIQNITNLNDLKAKLNDIIAVGKDYEYDVSSCMKSLLKSNDQSIVLLTVQAISELAKCDDKRNTYAQPDIIEPIIKLVDTELCPAQIDILKQCCRSLGNLCCDCDVSRKIILESDVVKTFCKLLDATVVDTAGCYAELKIVLEKMLLNYALGGQEFVESLVEAGLADMQGRILEWELDKDDDDMDFEIMAVALSILSAISDTMPEVLFDPETIIALLRILRDTTNLDLSETCLEILHAQAEHDSVKGLIATGNGVHLVCMRLELLLVREEAEIKASGVDIENLVKQACDLIIIVLTGDVAMHSLYKNGKGEMYLTMVSWLDAENYSLKITSILAIGNFARQDKYCAQMMEKKIFDKLLNIFEEHHKMALRYKDDPSACPVPEGVLNKVQHAALSAIRNLTVAPENKRAAAAGGRAAPVLLAALPHVDDHHVAYKLLAAIRMLVDGQEEVARALAARPDALGAAARWGRAAEHAGAAGEAPRLLAWAVRQARAAAGLPLLQVEGCVAILVNMLVASHSVMQNEAILALTIIGSESFARKPDKTFDPEASFASQLIQSEIGKHLSVLIETNCMKMPVDVAENLMAFLDITVKNADLIREYKEAKVHESLQKFAEWRSDFSEELKKRSSGVVTAITDAK